MKTIDTIPTNVISMIVDIEVADETGLNVQLEVIIGISIPVESQEGDAGAEAKPPTGASCFIDLGI